MKAQTKYLPCKPEDLRIGGVVEIHTSDGWHVIYLNNGRRIDSANILISDYPNLIRVPALSHEDIVGEGWEWLESGDLCNFYQKWNDSVGYYHLSHYYDCDTNISLKWQDYGDDMTAYFTIRTLPEFRDLMRFLGITCELKNKSG